MLPPFYYKDVTDEGLFRFFASVIEAVGDERWGAERKMGSMGAGNSIHLCMCWLSSRRCISD